VAVACAEVKDMARVNAALEMLHAAASFGRKDQELSDFEAKLMILNITAALADNGEFETASRLLASIEHHLDELPKMSIQRVYMLCLDHDLSCKTPC
jgi:hypothetical protein